MTNEDLLEEAINCIAERNNSISGWTENEEVDYREFCIYALEQSSLDAKLHHLNTQHSTQVEYEILEEFMDGNGDECIYLKVKE